MSMYRIANWNVERPSTGTKKTKLVLNKIDRINAKDSVCISNQVRKEISFFYSCPFNSHFSC